MLDHNQPIQLPAHGPTPAVIGRVNLAKWPPDDDDNMPAAPPPGGGIPGGGGFDAGDGNFKKGRFNPVVILVALVAVATLVVFLFVGFKEDAKRLTVEEAAAQKKALFLLPQAEQLPKWRQWAASEASDLLRSEALKQLAWAKDPAGVDLAIAALKAPTEPIQSQAATALAEYGSPAADKARDALLMALKQAGPGAKPQIAWALVELGDNRAFEQIMQLYRIGHLSRVQRLDKGLAFDPNEIVKLVSLDKLATYAGDESPAVRQLVATVLSENADPKFTDVLIKLLNDQDAEIARQAAPGLGKIGDDRARQPLLRALRDSDKESRKKFLLALRDGIGGAGLVLALQTVSDDPKSGWFQTRQIFKMLEKLADPRATDPLLEYINTKPHIHWQTQAATIMAEVGDVRAVPTLALRLRMDPLKIYSDEYDWEMMLKRDDDERVIASRMIADLAQLHQAKVDDIRAQSEDALIFWIHQMPAPHANGLRALAAMGSDKDIESFRSWADPDVPLPKEGQQELPQEWIIAQSAMRYVGWLRDEPSWKTLVKGLTMRPQEIDVTMDALMQGGLAVLGMTLRGVGVGASHGFSEWGDNKAFPLLMDYIEDERNNEQSRMEACAALAWVAEAEDMLEVAKKIQEYDGENQADQVRRMCFLETLIQRPVPGTAPALMQLMNPNSAMGTRHQVARAIGKAGLDANVEAQLFGLLDDEALMNDAALALILGGDPGTASRAVARYADKSKEAIEELQDLWYRSFGYWSHEDLEKGRIFDWVDNAVAISHITIRETPQQWAKALLMRQFDNLHFDNGPHSFTRVVLRYRLWQMAQGDDANKRAGAIRTLKFMKEQGVLHALREMEGATGELARDAFHELMNPVMAQGVINTEQGEEAGADN